MQPDRPGAWSGRGADALHDRARVLLGWTEDDPGVATTLAQVCGRLGDHVPGGVRRDPALVQLGRERSQPIVGVHRVTPFVTMSFTGWTKVSQALPPARSAAYPSSVSR